jgi:dTDP-4-dehydrorhamnose 3,5-epimerase-like enzyme
MEPTSKVRRMVEETFLGGKVFRIPTQSFEDVRGVLTSIEFTRYGFQSVRAFVVAAPAGAVRGGHGHAKGRQILMQISGEIELEVAHRNRCERVMLDAQRRAVLIEPPVWSRQTYGGENPSIIVFCDTPYDPDDYLMIGH